MGCSRCFRPSASEVEMNNTIDPKACPSMLAAFMKQQRNGGRLKTLESISPPLTIPVAASPGSMSQSLSLEALLRGLSGAQKPVTRSARLRLFASREARLQDEVQSEVKKIFRERWTTRD